MADEVSAQEIELAAEAGLKPVRTYGEKQFKLIAVVPAQDQAGIQTLEQHAQEARSAGRQCKIEKKSACCALYGRIF
ncbi:MAG: hypothetical protein NTV88_03595 [Candidatus Micrarchaeota archaeon]|nr:hypothetical protein [Candidatus Micrarchaeota archaeon]